MARNHLVRFLGYPKRCDYLRLLQCQGLYFISAVLYALTLEGGDLEYLKAKMTYFVFLLILSVISALAATVWTRVAFTTTNSTLKTCSWILGASATLFTVTRDLGASLTNHGQFNLFVYFLMWLPIVGGWLMYEGCNAAKRRVSNAKVFWGVFAIVIAGICLYLVWALQTAADVWYTGLNGKRLTQEWPSCGIYPPGVPWVGALPHRTFNFFTGSSQCPVVAEFSTLKQGVLQVHCNLPTAELIENPDYISMRNDTFVLLETGMELWQNRTHEFERRTVIPGRSTAMTTAEWMEVRCGQESNYHVQNVKNQSTVDRLIASSQKHDTTRLNLLVIMMDTVSRAQFYRKMPHTVQTLNELNRTDEFQVFQFFRLISNGFATEMNTKAMYTGSLNRRERSGRPYWDILRSQGNAALYINGFCEDWMSTFLKKPFAGADHFAFLQWCHPDYHPFERTFGNFAGPFSILRRCIAGRHVHNRIFDYVKDYWRNYKDWGKVVHIPLQEGHEGTGEVVLTLDQDLANFVQHLKGSGELNKTVLVLTSDHGSHMGPYYMAGGMGEFEQKMPLLLFIFPAWFLRKYPEFGPNLLAHEQAVVSHYDTHWTIRHLATLPEFGGDPANYVPEENEYVDVWDCKKNRDYMEVVHQFRGKAFTRGVSMALTAAVFEGIDVCFELLQYSPLKLPRSTVPAHLIASDVEDTNRPFVEDVITDKFAYFWFLDAAKHIELYKLKFGEDFKLKGQAWIEEDKLKEFEAWSSLRAPGRGRFLFGHSLLKHREERTCSEAGIPECVCSQPQSKYLRGIDDYR